MSNKHENIYGNLKVIQNAQYQWGVEDLNGNIIVPYGKYGWISGFDSGLARVNKKEKDPVSFIETGVKWGVINECGEEVLPVEYDAIWNFLGKGRTSTRVEKNGESRQVNFYDLNPKLPRPQQRIANHNHSNHYAERAYGSRFGEYAGTYAQDCAGFSDDVINDAFEGDPDMYWNID